MKSTLKNILFITLPTLVLLFSILEIYIRISKSHIDLYALTGRKLAPNPMSNDAVNDPFCAYNPKPGVYGIKSGGKTVNSHGFISTPEIPLVKPANTVRIAFLGSSSTAGTGMNLKDEDTWPWKVVEKLKMKSKLKFDFINASAGGYSLFESFGKLWSRIRFYKPDIIIVYHGWSEMYYFNDKMANDPTSWRKDNDGSFRVDKMMYATIFPPHWIDPFVSWSQILTRLRIFIYNRTEDGGEVAATGTSTLASTYNKKGLEIFKENLDLTHLVTKYIGAELFVCKEPTLITPNTSEKDKLRCHYEFHGFNHEAHIDAFNEIYRIIEKEIDNSHVIDLTSLSGISENFHDHGHPTETGADKIAEIVSDSISKVYVKIQ
jgi:hypothetical protein